VPAEGFEPPTYGLQNRCTTTVLSRHGIAPAAFYRGTPRSVAIYLSELSFANQVDPQHVAVFGKAPLVVAP
jgi:hypothetical protein